MSSPINSINWSNILSGVALIIAILCPFLTAVLSNRYQRKTFEADYYDRHRTEVIERYISAAGAAAHKCTDENYAAFGKYYGEIYFYVSPELWQDIDEINELLRSYKTKEAGRKLDDFCKRLAEEPPRTKAKRRNRNKH